MKSPYDIIKAPRVTEKGTILKEKENKYIFIVAPRANKDEIKKAIEEIFKVKVTAVHTSYIKGKVRRVGRYSGKTPNIKRAIITLKKGDKIELFEGT
jgi:large subunit ribosomal protein L23